MARTWIKVRADLKGCKRCPAAVLGLPWKARAAMARMCFFLSGYVSQSILGKTLSILEKRVVKLTAMDSVQFFVCKHISFPLVSVSRFRTIMAKDFMAPLNQTVPIVRQGTLVYLTPTVISYLAYSGLQTKLEISSLMHNLNLKTIDLKLRGITDSTYCEYDHLSDFFIGCKRYAFYVTNEFWLEVEEYDHVEVVY